MTSNNDIAVSYGDAIFTLAEEVGQTELIKADAEMLLRVIGECPSYLSLTDTPSLSREERLGLVDSSLGSLNEYLLNMIKILTEKRAMHALPSIINHFMSRYDESRGIERVEAVTAIPMSAEQQERLKAKLEGLTGKQIVVKNTVDPALLGGMKLRYSGIQLDGSIKTKLDSFEKSLSALVI